MVTAAKAQAGASSKEVAAPPEDTSYVVPVLHTHLPARAVELGFWGGLVGAALIGAIDPPLAVMVGAGVMVARHRRR